MRTERKAYFQYYETFEKIVQKFQTAEERDEIRTHIVSYGLYGIEPETMGDKEQLVWDIIKDMIDDQVHRREVNRQNREKRREQTNYNNKEQTKTNSNDNEEKPTKIKRFVKPSVQEVQEYCNQRKNGLNAQQFVDYYEARGWKIGNNSMKDWKAAVRTWEQRRQTSVPMYRNDIKEWPEEKLTL